MSLQFVLGKSGYGKSTYVQKRMIEEAACHRENDYLMIVPDQFTMQTQMIMTGASPDGGILNIDVLSFGRLTHRIFSEVGKPERTLLDDLGKCLILRRVIHEKENELKVLKKGIHSPGFTKEVKSVLSEFMTYGIRPSDLNHYIETLSLNPALKYKLEDFLLLYNGFEEALANQYTTKEETLYCLAERIPLSGLIKRSVIVFDGFTGFTPIQITVIEALLSCAKEVIITLPYERDSKAEFFFLSEKTIRDVSEAAGNAKVEIKNPVYLSEPVRFKNAPSIAYLERNLFRKEEADYPWVPEEIHISRAKDENHECMLLCKNLFRLAREKQYRYRDMAVVCGDLAQYEKVLKKQFEKYDIPYFMDATTELTKNPFVSFLRTVLNVIVNDYAYRDTASLLKSAFAPFTLEESDKLDNYILAKNIRGAGKWQKDFTALSREMNRNLKSLPDEEKELRKKEILGELNESRRRFTKMLKPLTDLSGNRSVTARQWLTALYEVITENDSFERIRKMSEELEQSGNPEKALEYSQVYKEVMMLFEQIVSLIGDEEISLSELSEVLDTGYGEIRIGIIPKSVDVLPVCDLIRSRIGDVKALFFIGVNDGNIPAVSAGGGLISDMERIGLLSQGMDLAPDRAGESFTEQLYLYQILTKPTEELNLSFLSVTETGESKKPSYLIGELKKMFPALSVSDETGKLARIDETDIEKTFDEHNILSEKDLKSEFVAFLSEYVNGYMSGKKTEYVKKLYAVLCADPENEKWVKRTVENAFSSYNPTKLEQSVASALYGEIMECSVSSLERFAGCAYAHFLRYGLGLQERETGEIDPSDLGNISHKTLELFGKYCRENHEDFALISLKKTEEIIDVLTEQLLSSYRDGIFKEEAGSEFMEKQVRRILKRSVAVLKNQLSKGDFVPASYEQEFKRLLSDPGALLVGKIDRVDTFTGEDTAYVKIVDYKTGSKDFEEELFHAGVQLQTAVYLSEAVKKYATDHPDKTVKPGAMFYCRMQDPFFESYDESEEKRESERNIALRPTGLLSGDEATLEHLEREHKDGKSEVIPTTYKDGAANGKTGNRAVKNEEEMQKILAEADEKVESLAKEILSGKIDVSPLVCGDSYNACEYCAFRSSCGFDARLPGYAVRKGAGGTEETKSEDE